MNATFNLLGDIVNSDADRFYFSDVAPAQVITWLAKQSGDVDVNINSLGGSVTGGLAIANAIKAYKGGTVTANVMGVAASIASVVACAADEIKMGKGAFFMIHNPWAMAQGEAEDLRKEADVLDQMKASIIGFYQTKFDLEPEKLAELMDAETWIADTDCEAYGMKAGTMESELKAAASATRRAFAKAPDAAKAYFVLEQSEAQWKARLAGLQAAKDKEIAALKAQVEDTAKLGGEAIAEIHERMDAVTLERDQLKVSFEEAQAEAATRAAAMDAMRQDIENFKTDIAEKAAALENAKAELEQLNAKYGEAQKALAETQADLEAEIKRYRDQVGLAMQPAEDLPTFEEGLAKCATPAERSAFIASGLYKKD